MNKTYCNRNLPANAINCADIEAGHWVRFAFEDTGVHVVERVFRSGQRITLHTDKGVRYVSAAGTARLCGFHADGYDYHYGHGCK